jgi:D-3-phosphoglycerate dehydrogenase
MKVLFLDTAHPSLESGLSALGFSCTDGTKWSLEETKEKIGEFTGLVIRSRIILDQPLLTLANKLRFIARVGAGMEGIDTAFAGSKDIACLNAPEGNRDAVGEHAIGMLLSLMNNLLRADRQVRNGAWIREENRGRELGGKTVGIIGYGNTGSAFAEKLKGFKTHTLVYDKYKKNFSDAIVKESSLEEIFSEADVLSLHVPLTDETRSLVNNDFLKRFRKNIFLINTSRGPVVKTADLVKNLQSGKVLGACLDVLEYEEGSFETLRAGNPDLNYLFQSDKVILTPHIAGWTHESHEKLAKVLLQKIKNLELL